MQTYIHTHDIQGYRGHTTTNLLEPIAVTLLGMMRVVIPVSENAPYPIVRRELSAANDSDTKDGHFKKASDSRVRGEVCRYNIIKSRV